MRPHHEHVHPWLRRQVARAGGFKCEYRINQRGGEGWTKRSLSRKEPLVEEDDRSAEE